jgi:hypothetical protein
MDFLTYICALPYPKRRGRIPELITDNPVAIDAFAKRWDRPGYGVYECVSLLRPGSRRRSLENVGYSWLIHLDIDLRTLKETYEEVLRKLKQLPSWIEIRDSGGGGFHLIIKLKEWAEAGSKEFERANTARTRLTHILRADKAPDHAAALLRKLGTEISSTASRSCAGLSRLVDQSTSPRSRNFSTHVAASRCSRQSSALPTATIARRVRRKPAKGGSR